MKKLFTYLLLLVTVITMQINGHQTSAKDAQAEERVVVTLGFDESRPLPINVCKRSLFIFQQKITFLDIGKD